MAGSERLFQNRVDKILNEGGDINELSDGALEDGGGLLHEAASNGFTNVVRNLLDRGADIHLKDKKRGSTALHWAARNGCTDVVRLLIERGANIDEENKVLETPTHLAIWNHHKEALEVFLEKGIHILNIFILCLTCNKMFRV